MCLELNVASSDSATTRIRFLFPSTSGGATARAGFGTSTIRFAVTTPETTCHARDRVAPFSRRPTPSTAAIVRARAGGGRAPAVGSSMGRQPIRIR